MKWKQMALLVGLLGLPAVAGVERVGEAETRFTGKSNVGVALGGKTSELSLTDDGKTVTFRVPLDTLQTGIDLRDQHMRERYLETNQYPHAALEVPWSAIQLPEEGKSLTRTVGGRMTIRQRTRDVTITYTIHNKGGVYEATGKVPLDIRDFGITVPQYLGVKVKPDVEAALSLKFKKG
jgi:polyisoprenoid-binding protein YceI